MKDLLATLRPAAISLLLFTALCGLAYPAAMIVIGAMIPHPSPSELVGKAFDDPAYFWGRPSAVSYNAMTSSGTNLGPTNPATADEVHERIATLRAADPGNMAKVPIDLVTASASGLDPDISPAAAYYQAARVARVRNVPIEKIKVIIERTTEERTFGVLGERRVNVVRLNRALDAAFARR